MAPAGAIPLADAQTGVLEKLLRYPSSLMTNLTDYLFDDEPA